MRGRVIAGGIVSSAAVLVIGWQLGGQPAVTASHPQAASGGTSSGTGSTDSGSTDSGSSAGGSSGSGSTGSGSSGSGSTGSSSTGSSSTGSGTAGSTGSGKDGTYAGQTAQTQYGPVQVQITVSGGKLSDVTALQLTNDGGRSVMISQQAAPILRQEALQAQSAQIQAVSGATFTSEGYITSLQSALDQAGL